MALIITSQFLIVSGVSGKAKRHFLFDEHDDSYVVHDAIRRPMCSTTLVAAKCLAATVRRYVACESICNFHGEKSSSAAQNLGSTSSLSVALKFPVKSNFPRFSSPALCSVAPFRARAHIVYYVIDGKNKNLAHAYVRACVFLARILGRAKPPLLALNVCLRVARLLTYVSMFFFFVGE